MRKLNDNHLRILKYLQRVGRSGECLPTALEISFRCDPRRMGDWAGSKLAALENKGLVRRMGVASSNARTWDITEAGIEALQKENP